MRGGRFVFCPLSSPSDTACSISNVRSRTWRHCRGDTVLYIVDVNRADEPNAFDAARTHAERSYLVDQYRAAYLPNELQQLLSAASALTERKLHTHVAADGLAGFPFGSIEQIALLNSPTFQKALRGVSRQQRHNGAPLRPLHAWVWPES